MWKWVAIAAAVPAGAAALVCAIGALLPRDHVAAAEALVPAPPDAVAALVRDVAAYPRWRAGVRAVEGIERRGGGLAFVERSDDGAIAFLLVEEAPGRRFRSTITDPGLPFGGYWTIALEPAAGGARVRIEEHGFVGNVVFRFVSALILGHDKTIRAYLADLARAATGRGADAG